ncbi:hypothetical protein KGF56_003253 [Candida oxycetoniae]|uniref:Uncharacterized protein n=1 Tax=Candida oxycetoniae TaxID=497107 RepID=A0AAI9SVR8_9ASCO|nr:uncharacterized protein KGF56_003253 [Candida oxycetoniae]KAI3403986.1 hypothetical protein KGF56_003253 [Candida oxycetoniae]
MSGGPVPIWKKYTTRSRGIWEKLRQLLVLVPNRSSGNPVVSLFRSIPPGERVREAKAYQDPITVPAGDIKGNPYFKRDYRRNYPQTHAFDQTKISGLLQLGNAAHPRISIGDKGNKELSTYTAAKEVVCLSNTLSHVPETVVRGEILGQQGEPIVAPSLNKFKWEILPESVHGMYTDQYPCRMFTDIKSKNPHPLQQSTSPL